MAARSIFMHFPVPAMPIDFELPDYLRGCKPVPYTLIRRSVYLTKKKRPDNDGMQCTCSLSPTYSSGKVKVCCGEDCLCAMLFSCCSPSCGCAPKLCMNRPFHQRPFKKMTVAKTENCGWGLKACEDIKAGEFVIEYVGEVINHKICQQRVLKMEEFGETNFYLLEIGRDMVVDASEKGNLSRFINHSCRPNAELQKWQSDGETRIAIFAKADIKEGEFVTYDYQFKQFGTSQRCYCGAENCRGILGSKPKPKPVCGQRVRVWWPLDCRFYSGKIVAYDPATDQHTIFYDDEDIETLVMINETWEFDSGMPEIPITPVAASGSRANTNGSEDLVADGKNIGYVKHE